MVRNSPPPWWYEPPANELEVKESEQISENVSCGLCVHSAVWRIWIAPVRDRYAKGRAVNLCVKHVENWELLLEEI